MKGFTLLLSVFLLIFSSCRFTRVEYYSDGKLVKEHFRTTLTHSTSYTKWGKKVTIDSASGRKISKTRYVKKVSCFNTHYKRFRRVEYDSAGKKYKVRHEGDLPTKSDTAKQVKIRKNW